MQQIILKFSAYLKQTGGRDSTPTFLRTHPLDETRIANLKKWQAEAKAAAQKN